MFEDEEAYKKNAESPVQHAIFLTIRACLERDPEWPDVDQVMSMGVTRQD